MNDVVLVSVVQRVGHVGDLSGDPIEPRGRVRGRRVLFGRDVRLEGPALDKAWADQLGAVELVHAEQLPVLRARVSRGVKVVYVEGLTAKGVEAWYAQALVVREQLGDEAKAKRTLAEAREMAAGDDGQLGGTDYEFDAALDAANQE